MMTNDFLKYPKNTQMVIYESGAFLEIRGAKLDNGRIVLIPGNVIAEEREEE